MEWRSEYEIGVPSLDEQHQELFRRVGQLVDAFRRGRRVDVAPLFVYLRRYVLEHFAAELREMTASGYADASRHAEAHAEFVTDLLALEAQYAADPGSPWVATHLALDLTRWLREHILGMDQQLGAFLRAR